MFSKTVLTDHLVQNPELCDTNDLIYRSFQLGQERTSPGEAGVNIIHFVSINIGTKTGTNSQNREGYKENQTNFQQYG